MWALTLTICCPISSTNHDKKRFIHIEKGYCCINFFSTSTTFSREVFKWFVRSYTYHYATNVSIWEKKDMPIEWPTSIILCHQSLFVYYYEKRDILLHLVPRCTLLWRHYCWKMNGWWCIAWTSCIPWHHHTEIHVYNLSYACCVSLFELIVYISIWPYCFFSIFKKCQIGTSAWKKYLHW